MELYKCRDCGELKPYVKMAKDASKEGGLKTICLKCHNAYTSGAICGRRKYEDIHASIDHGAVTLRPGDPGFAEMAAQCTHIKDIEDRPKSLRIMPNDHSDVNFTVGQAKRLSRLKGIKAQTEPPIDSVISG